MIMTQRQESSDAVHWRQALAFVSSPGRKAAIVRYARRFMVFSPYDVQDYLCEAHLAAFEAMKVCLRKNEPERYEGYFWTLVKSAFAAMSTNPSQRDIVPGEDAGPMAVVFEPYTEAWSDDETSRPTRAAAASPDVLMDFAVLENMLSRQRIREALGVMTARERDVWLALIEGRDTREIALMLGTSRQNVEKLRESGMKRVLQQTDEGRRFRTADTLLSRKGAVV